MFKFNFGITNEDEEVEHSNGKDDIEWYQSCEVDYPSNEEAVRHDLTNSQINKVDFGNGLVFSCLLPNEIVSLISDESDVQLADKQHSDLIPGKYEGGLKIWECTKDLAIFFSENVIQWAPSKLNGKYVLDLGCGSGILGIMCLQNEATVTFQDYNKEVLEASTIPNVILNNTNCKGRASFYSGDWSSFQELYTTKCNNKFDYILTSETIYNENNYHKLINIFKTLLHCDGTIYVAAKSHYFGVGGTVFEFNTKLQMNNFKTKVVWETSQGVSRQILEVKFGDVTE